MYGNGFYNPYMYSNFINTANIGRAMTNIQKPALGLNGLFKKFSFSGFLNGASKTLNVVNQAIPIYYQVKPMISNAKTMFKVMKAVKTPDQSKTYTQINNNYKENNNTPKKENYSNNGNPTFFL